MDVKVFCFSPVGNTEKIAMHLGKTLARHLGGALIERSFTLPQERQAPLVATAGEIVILALPVYAGRLPNVMAKYLQTMEATGALCVPVVVYGNRNFDDALTEGQLVCEHAGGQVIGGGAFVAQHSFSKTLAVNRPDELDMAQVEQFATALAQKIQAGDTHIPLLAGNNPPHPYYTPRDRHGNGIDIRKVTPKVGDGCVQCGLCAQHCPMGSINPANVKEMQGICIKCCACEKRCPVGVRYFDDPNYIYHRKELEEMYSRRAEPVWFV
ncbi:EFR1 family ferrodoxin [Bengtsoniella intestinalis]|uniref:EFR1 family ferrodoxin n=1 Tax=Bengtsoniella intestinalis TaxID=3073143 RepID=UPI00391F4445